MAGSGLDGFLLCGVENAGYFTGLFLEGLRVLVLPGETTLFAGALSLGEAAWYAPPLLDPRPEADFWAPGRLSPLRRGRFGVEPELPASVLARLGEKFPRAAFRPSELPAAVRAVKEPGEIDLVRTAGRLTAEARAAAAREIAPGARETAIAAWTRDFFARRGAETAFPPVCASGYASFFPHAVPRPAAARQWTVWDFGARWRFYCADCTRVLFPERLSGRGRRRLEALREAVAAAAAAAVPGAAARAVDEAARKVLRAHGLEKYFIHGLGHGVGLSVHEKPVLNPRSEDILRPGMVVTIEPGVYLPGWGGLRLEDSWLVSDRGLENLTGSG